MGVHTLPLLTKAAHGEVYLRNLRRRNAQRVEAGVIGGGPRPVGQGIDMSHRQRRTIEEEKGPAGGAVIAPHLDGAVLAHKGGAAQRGLQRGGREVEIGGRFTARRGAGNGRSAARRRRLAAGGATGKQQDGDQAGDGALQFALAQGFKKENLLTAESEAEWKDWLKTSEYKPKANIENHDTIGMVALDMEGNFSGACTTSGMAFKMHGRVGDSPIIGAGLYVDNEVGAVTATGHGEEVIRIVGCHTVIELMRQGLAPELACKKAVERIINSAKKRNKSLTELQIGFIAINKHGEHGAFCLQKGFNYAVYSPEINNQLFDAKSLF